MKPLLLTLALLRGADGATTFAALHAGTGVEGNPMLPKNPAAITAVVAGIGVAQDQSLRRLAVTHPRIAKALAFGSIAIEAWATQHNARIIGGQK